MFVEKGDHGIRQAVSENIYIMHDAGDEPAVAVVSGTYNEIVIGNFCRIPIPGPVAAALKLSLRVYASPIVD